MLKVDAALGAEEMVQQQADSKLTLEERVREEVDLANSATREV
jgi:hypothetical protein